MIARVERIVETALYVDDLPRASRFYADVIGCSVLLETPRLIAMSVAGESVLLLFQRGATADESLTEGGMVPGHGAQGDQHLAFAIARDAVPAWLQRLEQANVAVESRVQWPRGGESLYVRDPDGHSVEFITPGLWAIY